MFNSPHQAADAAALAIALKAAAERRYAGRSRTPGPVRPAGAKLARMAAEGRIGKG